MKLQKILIFKFKTSLNYFFIKKKHQEYNNRVLESMALFNTDCIWCRSRQVTVIKSIILCNIFFLNH